MEADTFLYFGPKYFFLSLTAILRMFDSNASVILIGIKLYFITVPSFYEDEWTKEARYCYNLSKAVRFIQCSILQQDIFKRVP